MELTVDTNIIVSALIKDGLTRKILFEPDLSFFSPEFIIDETYRHIDEIAKKADESRETIEEVLNDIFSKANIIVIPFEELKPYVGESKELTPDIEDVLYFACALKTKSPIWSNENKLKNQKKVEIIKTHELIDKIEY